jgi:hypothetical protein
MPRQDLSEQSPIIGFFRDLHAMHPRWYVEMGRPSGSGWIAGIDLGTGRQGPFHALLVRIGEGLQTSDRRTIAAAFALRYGWSSGIAIAPYLFYQCVPNLSLDNVSFKFLDNTLFERAALHRPEGVMLHQEGRQTHPSIRLVPTSQALLGWLRASLVQQAEPVVAALYDWSHFSLRGMWGMITSSWGSQFINIVGEMDGQERGLPQVRQFFAGNDLAAQMQPHFYPITYNGVTHVYHRRSSCCRYYKIPQGEYCASCPIVPRAERVQRNRDWMKALIKRPAGRPAPGL